MTILALDTETTGLPVKGAAPDHPSQPHIAQLGAILYDDARHVVAELNLLVRPDGWTIPKEASAIHGITQESAERFGVAPMMALNAFWGLASRADLLVAHNYDFDCGMIVRELRYLVLNASAEIMKTRPHYCTMKAATPIMNLPPTERMLRAGFDKPKPPNLQEAHTHFCGRPFDGVHDAMADVRACAAVYFAINPIPVFPLLNPKS